MRLLCLLLVLLFAAPAWSGIGITDQNSAVSADVESNAGTTRNELNVNTGTAPATAGYIRSADDLGRALAVMGTDDFRPLMTCALRPAVSSQVEGAALDARVLNWSNVTMTQTQSAGVITLNAGSSVAINTNSRLTTHKVLPYYEGQPALYTFSFRRPTTVQNSETVEIGAFNATVAVAPTDGVFFRWNASGEFRVVSVFNSVESQSIALTPPTANVTHVGMIARRSDGTDFWIDGVKVASIEEATQTNPVSVRGLPFSARVYIGGTWTGSSAPQIVLGPWSMSRCGDMDKPWGSVMATMGNQVNQAPLTPFAQTTNHVNSTSPTSATLSNTAAGYTTLGGRYQFAAPLGAATDYALFAYTVPTGYQLHVTGVSINACNTGAAVATTATILDWGLGINSTDVTLVTADSFPAAGPVVFNERRVPLGVQGFPLVAPNGPTQIGDCAADIVRTFDPPLVVDSARFFHVIVQVPVGTATASQIIRGDVLVQGYFE